jgi:hypothetical protein
LEVPKDKNKEKYAGPVASVPDSGSTALLLGTSLLVLGVASGGSMNLAFKSLAAWVRYASLQGFQNKTCKFAELARKYANTAMLAYHISMTSTLAFRWVDDVAPRRFEPSPSGVASMWLLSTHMGR